MNTINKSDRPVTAGTMLWFAVIWGGVLLTFVRTFHGDGNADTFFLGVLQAVLMLWFTRDRLGLTEAQRERRRTEQVLELTSVIISDQAKLRKASL
jgi:hypothetical protein